MDNLGLLAGLANGVKEGMLAYQTQKQIRRQQDMENLNRGVVEDPDTGELRYTPEMQQKLQKQQELQNLQLEKLKKELGGEGSLEDQYKKAQIDYLRSKMGTESARAGLLGAKEKGLIAPKMPKAEGQPKELGFKDVSSLRKEFTALPEVKQFNEVSIAYDKVKKAAEVPSAAGDMSLIFGYMKMLDPNSTVREGEYANAQNAAGIPDQIRNAYNKAKEGTILAPNQRQDFVKQAGNVFEAQKGAFQRAQQKYSEIGELYKVKPEYIFGKQGLIQATPAQPQFEPDVLEYAKTHNMSPQQAAQIKAARSK